MRSGRETLMTAHMIDAWAVAYALADILNKQDPKKGDLSHRAEGTFEAIAALAKIENLPLPLKNLLANTVRRCCKTYSQVVEEVKGFPWPTNRFALEALHALGKQKPSLQEQRAIVEDNPD